MLSYRVSLLSAISGLIKKLGLFFFMPYIYADYNSPSGKVKQYKFQTITILGEKVVANESVNYAHKIEIYSLGIVTFYLISLISIHILTRYTQSDFSITAKNESIASFSNNTITKD